MAAFLIILLLLVAAAAWLWRREEVARSLRMACAVVTAAAAVSITAALYVMARGDDAARGLPPERGAEALSAWAWLGLAANVLALVAFVLFVLGVRQYVKARNRPRR